MTLNFSHRPIFPVNSPEDNLFSSMRIDDRFIMEGIQDKPWNCSFGFEDNYDYGRDRTERGSSCDPTTGDILDLLPSDPFGMNVGATFTAITGWIDYFEMDALNFIWNNAIKFHSEPGNIGVYESLYQKNEFDGWVEEKGLGNRQCDSLSVTNCNADELMTFCDKYTQAGIHPSKESVDDIGSCSSGSGGDPHEALIYVLGYLGVQELLSVERVCRSLHSAVQTDPLLWRTIHIDQPLSERIDDDTLLWITSRAQGNLQCLSLVKCSRITDDGLKRVLESNPRLTKLSVPECTRLTVEGILNNLKAFKSLGAPCLKHLRIGGRYDVTHEHLEEFKVLLGIDESMQSKACKPRIYYGGHSSLSHNDDHDDRAIDIEICPRCESLRLVYDCPVKSCQVKYSSTQLCRACTICISRCFQCGRCVNDGEYVETFCLDKLCLNCVKEQPEDMSSASGASSKLNIVEQNTEYQLHLCG